jgi:transcriptional regulator with XRE-family HTH domain
MHRLESIVWIRKLARSGEARRIRERLGISVPELAVALRVHPSSLSRWETGRATPRAGVARRWAVILVDLGAWQVTADPSERRRIGSS